MLEDASFMQKSLVVKGLSTPPIQQGPTLILIAEGEWQESVSVAVSCPLHGARLPQFSLVTLLFPWEGPTT